MTRCRMEQCENWSGDGNACPCAVFDLTPTPSDDNEQDEDGE